MSESSLDSTSYLFIWGVKSGISGGRGGVSLFRRGRDISGSLCKLKLFLNKVFILISRQLEVYIPDLDDDKYPSYQGRAIRPW